MSEIPTLPRVRIKLYLLDLWERAINTELSFVKNNSFQTYLEMNKFGKIGICNKHLMDVGKHHASHFSQLIHLIC